MRELGQRPARDGAALFGAVVLHALALALIAHVAVPGARTAAVPTTTSAVTDALDVELVDDALGVAPASAGLVGASEETTFEPSRTVRAAMAGARRAASERPGELAPAAALEVVEAPATLAPGTSAVPPSDASATPDSTPERAIDLGLGGDGWKRWLASDHPSDAPPHATAPGVPVVRAPPASTTGGLQEGLIEADLKRVVGPSGRVVNALEDAAHGDGATAFGVARFAVTVLRTGGIEVKLESASAGEAEWKRVAERAAANLRANAPTIRPPSDGARFVVDLSAEMLLVDGRHVRTLHGPRVEATPPRIQTWAAGERDMVRNNPTAASGLSRTDQMRAIVEIPGVYVTQNGKVCSYRFGLSLLGPLAQGGCELENLGTKPQRVVHAHVTRQELF
jgi:hypothetical protein